LKVRVRCCKCGWESIGEINLSPLDILAPKEPNLNIDDQKQQIQNLLGTATGASDSGIRNPDIKVTKESDIEEDELIEIYDFILHDIVYSDDRRLSSGEKYKISAIPWRMGDQFKDVDITSSEVKALGIEDLRWIPGFSLQVKEYDFAKSTDKEMLRGSRFIVFLDVSGSMFAEGSMDRLPYAGMPKSTPRTKIGKALLIAEKIYQLCKRLDVEFNLAVFSDTAARIPADKLDTFFNLTFSPGLFAGGTTLSKALALYTSKEYKNSNLLIISDMDLADAEKTKDQIKRIGRVTNSFKILLFPSSPRAHTPVQVEDLKRDQQRKVKNIFSGHNVKILRIYL
jgi:hypothetical protein